MMMMFDVVDNDDENSDIWCWCGCNVVLWRKRERAVVPRWDTETQFSFLLIHRSHGTVVMRRRTERGGNDHNFNQGRLQINWMRMKLETAFQNQPWPLPPLHSRAHLNVLKRYIEGKYGVPPSPKPPFFYRIITSGKQKKATNDE